MCTLYYSQLQGDNGDLKERVELLETLQEAQPAISAPSLQKEVVRLKEINGELQRRVAQLEAENRSVTQVFSVKTEAKVLFPAVRGGKDLNYRLTTPTKKKGLSLGRRYK